jgi:hypothetical protein
MKKWIEIKFLQFAYYVLNGRNVHRCLYISRKDNNRLWSDSESLEFIIKRMKNDYKEPQ